MFQSDKLSDTNVMSLIIQHNCSIPVILAKYHLQIYEQVLLGKYNSLVNLKEYIYIYIPKFKLFVLLVDTCALLVHHLHHHT